MGHLRRIVLVVIASLAILAAGTPIVGATGQARFVPPHSDQGMDWDGDTLVNALRVNVKVDASTPGRFGIAAWLSDATNTSFIDVQQLSVSISGPATIPVDFPGATIRSSGFAGPYKVWLNLFDDTYALDDSETYTTQAYALNQFDPPSATFAPPHSAVAEDRDAPPDGLYDVFRVDVRLDVSEPGLYEVDGQLWDSAQTTPIDFEWRQAPLDPGVQSFSLTFPGLPIAQAGVDGPYFVELYLYRLGPRGSFARLDLTNVTMGAYLSTEFQPATTTVTGYVTDAAFNPVEFIAVEAYNYRDDAHLYAFTGFGGSYQFSLYPGAWVFAYADHDSSWQSALQRATITGGFVLLPEVHLPPAVVSPRTTRIGLPAWNASQTPAEYVGDAGNATFRLAFDFTFGDRNEWVTLDEWNRTLAAAGDLPAAAIDTRDRFLLDGASFPLVPGSDSVTYADFEGPIDSALSPVIRVNASYGAFVAPARSHAIALNVTFDTLFTNETYRVQFPPSYILASFTPTPSVSVRNLGGGLVEVDPGLSPAFFTDSAWITLTADTTDATPPTFASATASPDPVEVGQATTISAVVSDAYGVGAVNVSIRDPSGVPVGDFQMSLGAPSTYRYSLTASALGTYAFAVTAVDTNGNPATVSGTFQAQDTTSPSTDAGPDQTVPQHTPVVFDGSASTDNDRIANFTWTFTDGGSQALYGAAPAYVFDRAGTFAVTLTVRDPSGNSATDQVTVTVTPTTGSVQGTVRDDAGRPLAGATVRLFLGSAEVASATTDTNGVFAFPDVDPGTYSLRAEFAGFAPQTVDVTVVAGSTASKDFVLSAAAPSGLPAWVLPVGIVVVLLGVLAAVVAVRRRKRTADAPSKRSRSEGK